MRQVPVALFLLAAAFLWSGEAVACVTKTGKDCPVTVGQKAKGVDKHIKKVGKLAPVGNVGHVTHSSGIDQLGLPSANLASVPAASPTPADAFGSNPAGWFYLVPIPATGGFSPHPLSFRVLGATHLANPDGTLTQYAIDLGWVRVQAPAPSLVGAPTARQVQAPGLAPTRAPGPVQSVAPAVVQPTTPALRRPAPSQQAATPQQAARSTPAGTGATAAPAQPLVSTSNLAGHATSGTVRAHPDHPVDVYHPTRAGLYRYQHAHGIGDSAFHLVVVGIREPDNK
jgi:hypothetical protein